MPATLQPSPSKYGLTTQRRDRLLRVLHKSTQSMSALPKFTCPATTNQISIPAVKLSGRTEVKTTHRSSRQSHHQLPTTQRQPLVKPATKAWTTPAATTQEAPPLVSLQVELQGIEKAQREALQSTYHDQAVRAKQDAIVRRAVDKFTEGLLCLRPDDAFHGFELHKKRLLDGCKAACPPAHWAAIRSGLEAEARQVGAIIEANHAMFNKTRSKQTADVVLVKAAQKLQIHQRQLQSVQDEQENMAYAALIAQERHIQDRRVAARHASKAKTRKQHQAALVAQIRSRAVAHQEDAVPSLESQAPALPPAKVRPPWWIDDDARMSSSRRDDYDVDARLARLITSVERFGRKGAPWFDS